MQLNGSDIIMECLLEQGVDTVFGYPGGAVLNIYDALYKYRDRIRHIETSHEQGTAHAADGYARASGKTGVVIATSGPGATNLVTGIATAYMDSIPMVAITGNVGRSLLGLDSFQEVDITGVTIPITKHNYIVKDIRQLADTIREAFYLAQEGRRGPVLVDIPKDISAQVTEYEPKAPVCPPLPVGPSQREIANVAELLSKARRPFLYLGGGVMAAEGSAAAKELAERLATGVHGGLIANAPGMRFRARKEEKCVCCKESCARCALRRALRRTARRRSASRRKRCGRRIVIRKATGGFLMPWVTVRCMSPITGTMQTGMLRTRRLPRDYWNWPIAAQPCAILWVISLTPSPVK